jgi:hypothetical protein
MGRVRAVSGSGYSEDRGGVVGLRGEIGGRYSVPRRRVRLCQSRCSDRQEQEGNAYPLNR